MQFGWVTEKKYKNLFMAFMISHPENFISIKNPGVYSLPGF
jgi:hypothetical protein